MKYAFTNGKILNGTENMQAQEGLCILTDGEKITGIVPATTSLTGYQVIDLQGKYIMPGLINMHVHLAGNGKPQKKQRDNEKVVKMHPVNASTPESLPPMRESLYPVDIWQAL